MSSIDMPLLGVMTRLRVKDKHASVLSGWREQVKHCLQLLQEVSVKVFCSSENGAFFRDFSIMAVPQRGSAR